MSLLPLLSEALNFSQMMGFTAESAGVVRGVTAVTGLGQFLVTMFGGGDDGTVTAIEDAKKEIIAKIEWLGQRNRG